MILTSFAAFNNYDLGRKCARITIAFSVVFPSHRSLLQ